jgi:thiol-disulfide isomerase/thioredoxin
VISGIILLGASLWLCACGSRPVQVTDKKATGDGPAQPSASAPGRMPAFHLRDMAGHEVSSAQFQGKVVLLDFWATWCAPCKQEMPGYEKLYRRYRDRGLVVIGIAADSDATLVSKFAKQLKITYPLLISGMDVQRYGVEGLPTTLLVDRRGFVKKKVVGFEYTEPFENALRGLL